MINYHDSITHRLPPEILAETVSHLEGDKSLVIATHVCHFWRSALLSSPRLWSHLAFKNEPRASVFLERSKSAPIFLDLEGGGISFDAVGKSLKGITERLTGLRTVHVPFWDKLLIQPLPVLSYLEVVTSEGPSFDKSLTAANLGHLTTFSLTLRNSVSSPRIGHSLLYFLRSCPLLEVVTFGYGELDSDIELNTGAGSTEAVSLPRLRSFTHKSPLEVTPIGLFNRLSLPPTCDVAFNITSPKPDNSPGWWNHGFPALRDRSYLLDTKLVKIAFQAQGPQLSVIKTTFLDSKHRTVSLNKLMPRPSYSSSHGEVTSIMRFLENSESARSVEVLHFESCVPLPPLVSVADSLEKLSRLKRIEIWNCDPTLFLSSPCPPAVWCRNVEELLIHPSRWWPEPEVFGVMEMVRSIARLRKEGGSPLKGFTLFLPDAARLQACEPQIEDLMECVDSVEVLSYGASDNGGWEIAK